MPRWLSILSQSAAVRRPQADRAAALGKHRFLTSAKSMALLATTTTSLCHRLLCPDHSLFAVFFGPFTFTFFAGVASGVGSVSASSSRS